MVKKLKKGDRVKIRWGTLKGRIVKVVAFEKIQNKNYIIVMDKRWHSPRGFLRRDLVRVE